MKTLAERIAELKPIISEAWPTFDWTKELLEILNDIAVLDPISAAPASASATGIKGQYYIDTDYVYICVATDTWKRFAVSTWS